MKKKYIITRKNGCIISFLMEDGKLRQIDIEPEKKEAAAVGDVFAGKIKDIVPNIQAAFIEIGNGEMCYLSLEKLQNPVFLNPKKNEIPHQGDELLVQVSREAVKTKTADLTVNISITGRFSVLTHGKAMIGISGKIREERIRDHLKKLVLPFKHPEYGFILRTNAANASDEEILTELQNLIREYQNIRKKAEFSSCFSCLAKASAHFITDLRDMPWSGGAKDAEMEIVTDEPDIFLQLQEYLEKFQPERLGLLTFYEDAMISLWNLYGMEKHLERARNKKVWLPCGGYLIIEPTEALTVIDVNSGKAIGKKKDKEAAYFKVNQEAAKEIAVQIRLRNLSGIILVDFIDMKMPANREALISLMAQELKKDPIKTDFIDMTALHLAEITRKKVRKPLHEQILAYREPVS